MHTMRERKIMYHQNQCNTSSYHLKKTMRERFNATFSRPIHDICQSYTVVEQNARMYLNRNEHLTYP